LRLNPTTLHEKLRRLGLRAPASDAGSRNPGETSSSGLCG
jgi:hypothetical protein